MAHPDGSVLSMHLYEGFNNIFRKQRDSFLRYFSIVSSNCKRRSFEGMDVGSVLAAQGGLLILKLSSNNADTCLLILKWDKF